MREYFKYIEEHQDPMLMVPRDFADRCPECGFSAIEVSRKEAHGGAGE